MTASITQSAPIIRTNEAAERPMPFLAQVFMLTKRNLLTNLRVPAAILPGFIISVFFLLIYNSTLGTASGFIPGLRGQSYLGFILPLSVITGALSGSGIAGQAIVRDIERGYFDKLLLTPINRWALLLSPMLAGAIILALQTLLIIFVAVLMGLRPVTGSLGVLALVIFSLLTGVGFSGFSVAIALRTGSAAATQGASFLFFPLSFVTATFVPLELLSGWIKTAATVNPITYILDATRSILNIGWEGDVILKGLAACLVLGALMFAFALWSLRVRTSRK